MDVQPRGILRLTGQGGSSPGNQQLLRASLRLPEPASGRDQAPGRHPGLWDTTGLGVTYSMPELCASPVCPPQSGPEWPEGHSTRRVSGLSEDPARDSWTLNSEESWGEKEA